MTTFYLSSVDGSNSDDGTSWANAVATLKYAVETLAASGGPHTILVDSAHAEELSGDTTITAAQDLRIISVNRSGGDAPLALAVIGAQTTSYTLALNGAAKVYVYGLTIRNGTSSASKYILLADSDGSHFEFEDCKVELLQSGSAQPNISLGAGTVNNVNTYAKYTNCEFKFSNAGHRIRWQGVVELVGCTLTGTAPTELTVNFGQLSGARWSLSGCDLSLVTGKLFMNAATGGTPYAEMRQCKLGSGVVIKAAATGVLNKGQSIVTAYDCSAGDAHYSFYHGDAFGETTALTTYYADDGATTNGQNLSWKIVTTENCSYYTPYVTPWIALPWTGTSAVTATIEGLRVDSTTIIDADEVWGEWQYKGTSGEVTLTTISDRSDLLDTSPDDQTSSKAYTDWTGSPTDTDSGDSTFALVSASFTPAEAGHIFGRVCVGEPELTVYIDPQLRMAA